MSAPWLADVAERTLEAGLHREPVVRRAGAAEINLASNDYLGLSSHPAVIAGAHAALDEWGAGSTASRLVAGTTAAHIDFEDDIAAVSSVTAVGATERLELLAVDGGAAVAALAGADVQHHPVDEAGHGWTFSRPKKQTW